MDGMKEILGTWISENESASFYASICSDLKNRGVSDIFIACHDNLTGLCDAINAIFPKTKNQLCIYKATVSDEYNNVIFCYDKYIFMLKSRLSVDEIVKIAENVRCAVICSSQPVEKSSFLLDFSTG